jgi:hypothetical protein
MIFIDYPYVSDFLKQTIVDHQLPVVATPEARQLLEAETINWIPESVAASLLNGDYNGPVYTNSENSIAWIQQHAPASATAEKIGFFKNKVKFRKLMQEAYPDYFFQAVSYSDLPELDPFKLPYPLIVKPAVGFFSIAVHKVDSAADWKDTIKKIADDITRFSSAYPEAVLDNSEFILESYISGKEYAFDCYMDTEGKPVILNILHHLFTSEADVSDRVYSTSDETVLDLHDSVMTFLQAVQRQTGLKNFPLHIEIRVDHQGKVFPIEVNPMRFGGWCTTADITYFAYGINSYLSYFHGLKPDWEQVFENRKNYRYSLILLDNQLKVQEADFEYFDYDLLLKDFECPLHLRKHPLNHFGVFGFLFTRTTKGNEDELQTILHSDLSRYVRIKNEIELN